MSTTPNPNAISAQDILTYLRLGLSGAEALLAMLQLKSDTPLEAIQAAEAAVDALKKVQGNQVVLGELEAIRLKSEW